jgi:hypothetical protein
MGGSLVCCNFCNLVYHQLCNPATQAHIPAAVAENLGVNTIAGAPTHVDETTSEPVVVDVGTSAGTDLRVDVDASARASAREGVRARARG